jgi:hypothetical protein
MGKGYKRRQHQSGVKAAKPPPKPDFLAQRPKDAKKNPEAQNSKFETNPNDPNTTKSKRGQIRFEVLDFSGLGSFGIYFGPVCFGFRASDFGF